MATRLKIKRGLIVKPAATGAQVISGVGFRPDAVIFMWAGLTAIGGAAGVRQGFGVAGGTPGVLGNRWAQAWASDDNVGNTNTVAYTTLVNCIAIHRDGVGTNLDLADLTSFNADGFTLLWGAQGSSSATQYLVEYIAFGNISAKAGFRLAGAGSSGNKATTGIGFRPKALIMMAPGVTITGGTPASGAPIRPAIGIATAPTERGFTSLRHEDNLAAANLITYGRSTLIGSPTSSNTVDFEADFTSFDADGFTHNIIDTGVDSTLLYLALGGDHFQAKVTSHAQPVAPGQDTVSTLPFTPRGLFGLSGQVRTADDSATVTSQTRDGITVTGMRDGTSQACVWGSDVDAADPTNTDSDHNQSKFMRFLSNARATLAECNASLSGSGYTLDWTTADATARRLLVMAFGDEPDPPRLPDGTTKVRMVI